jgi:hypothetical protein
MNFSYGVAQSLYHATQLAKIEGEHPQPHHLLFAFSLRHCGASQALSDIAHIKPDYLHVELKRLITCQIEPIDPCAIQMYKVRPDQITNGCIFTPDLSICLDIAENYAITRCHANQLHTTHMLAAMIVQGHSHPTLAKEILDKYQITYDELDEYMTCQRK